MTTSVLITLSPTLTVLISVACPQLSGRHQKALSLKSLVHHSTNFFNGTGFSQHANNSYSTPYIIEIDQRLAQNWSPSIPSECTELF